MGYKLNTPSFGSEVRERLLESADFVPGNRSTLFARPFALMKDVQQ
jgi:hypothetical protein